MAHARQRQLRNEASSHGSGSGSRTHAIVPTTISLLPVDPTDPCLWETNRECSVPRSCHDCLNAALTKGQCMVDPLGRCVRLQPTDYRPVDVATGHVTDHNATDALYTYASTNTSYCEPRDTTCATCRTRTESTGWYYDIRASPNATTQLTPFCVGTGGCVCIATCEAPAWRATVLAVCSSRLHATQARQTTLYAVVMIVASALCAAMFFSSARWMKTEPPREEEDFVPRRGRRPTRPGLSLSAWHAMRQKLIDDEAGRQAPAARQGPEDSATGA